MISIILVVFSFFAHSGDSLSTNLDKYLKKNLSQYENIDYKITQIPNDYKEIKILENKDFNLCGNLVYIPVQLTTKNGRAVKSIITVRVKLYKNVLVTTRTLDKNQTINSADVGLKKMDITQIKGSAFTSAKEIESYRTKIFLRQGEPIVSEYVEQKPVVLTGDKVEAKLTSGSVVVLFDAFSRQDGTAGEIITIISKDKKQYKAKVVDSLNVNIIE